MKIKGVQFIEYKSSIDMRGKSLKISLQNMADMDFICNEIFISESQRDVIRGLHFQEFPYGQKKIITVLKGRIEGVILDLRRESDTYGKYKNLFLDANCGYSLYIPEYCAWGFHALDDNNLIFYSISGKYQKDYDKGINWRSIGFDWKVESPIVSERDQQLVELKRYMEGENCGKNEV